MKPWTEVLAEMEQLEEPQSPAEIGREEASALIETDEKLSSLEWYELTREVGVGVWRRPDEELTFEEFLRARLSEDMEIAGWGGEWERVEPYWELDVGMGQAPHLEVDPRRVITEAEVKLRLLHRHPVNRSTQYCVFCTEQYPCETLRLIALPYMTHPDWQPRWMPQLQGG